MRKIRSVLSIAIIIFGILIILFSPLIIRDIMYLNAILPSYKYYAMWLQYLLPITGRLITIGCSLIIVGIIYLLFGKE